MPDPVTGPTGSPPIQPPGTSESTSAQNAANAAKSLFEQLWEMLCGGGGFIANWNTLLAEKGQTLNYYNEGLSAYTQVLQWMSDFSQSSNNFDFNSWLDSQSDGSGNYTGSVADAQQKRDDYVTTAQNEQDNIKNAEDQIDKQMAQAKKDMDDGKITLDQYNELKEKLVGKDGNGGLKAQLEGADANLAKYIKDLKGMVFTAGVVPGTYMVTGTSVDTIKADEDSICNDPDFGLTTIYNETQNEATEYQTLSTTAQMEVSLIMSQTEQIMQIASSLQSSLFTTGDTLLKGIKGQ